MANIISQASLYTYVPGGLTTQNFPAALYDGLLSTWTVAVWGQGSGVLANFATSRNIYKVIIRAATDGTFFNKMSVLMSNTLLGSCDSAGHYNANPAIIEFTPVMTNSIKIILDNSLGTTQKFAEIEIYEVDVAIPLKIIQAMSCGT